MRVSQSLQTIFRQHFATFAQTHRLCVRELRAASAIINCHSAALGGYVLACPDGHHSQTQYYACRHRSCPRCAQRPRQEWVQAQLHQLLPSAHFHAVFTLPHDFLPLWEFNRAWINKLLFDCVRTSILELCADPRHLGAIPGLLMALHTWGRTLSLHPHVHCLISAGGLDEAGHWRHSKADYLVPVQALSALFRGKFLAHLSHALAHQRLKLPPQQDARHWRQCIRRQYTKHWNIELSKSYAHGRGVALYLARYVKGGPLGQERALHVNAQGVHFDYTDHRDGQHKHMTLQTNEFIRRVLWHAPVQGQHLVRHCGLYASAAKSLQCKAVAALRPVSMPAAQEPLACHAPPEQPTTAHLCPRCSQALVRTASVLPAHRFGEISKAGHSDTVSRIGSTDRPSGPTTASDNGVRRRRSLRRCSPLN
jgi:hypothetical protein